VYQFVLAPDFADGLAEVLEARGNGDAFSGFDFVARQHPYFDACHPEGLDCRGRLVLQSVLDSGNAHQLHIFFEQLHHLPDAFLPVLQ
jgi:hypothetical protein